MLISLNSIDGVDRVDIKLITDGDLKLSNKKNRQINKAVSQYIKETKRF